MRKSESVLRLRIFLSEASKHKGRPLYEEVVVEAQRARLADATVFRGILGYSTASALDPGKILGISKDRPIVIEIVDNEQKLKSFLNVLDQVLTSGVAMLEPVQLHRFRSKSKGQLRLTQATPNQLDRNSAADHRQLCPDGRPPIG